MKEKNLVGAKIGDKVVLTYSLGVAVNESIGTITGITKGGNFKIGSYIFYPNGNMRGDGLWSRTYAYIATSEDIKRIKEKVIIKKVLEKMKSTNRLTYSQAVKIAEILEMGDFGGRIND